MVVGRPNRFRRQGLCLSLKADPDGQLNRPRTTRSEHLRRSSSRPPKAGSCQIPAKAQKVCFVVQVKDLADHQEAPSVLKDERSRQTKIKGMEIVTERIVGRKNQGRY